jgi:hypothetical protein
MYKKFRLKNFEEEFKKKDTINYKKYLEIGKKTYENSENVIKKKLKEFLNYKGELDGNKIIEEWFSQEKFDIFLSHSHQDEELAIAIAGMLKEKAELKVFIDSQVWGYIDDLQKEIDNKYCKKNGKQNLYDYNKRNITTSHVHLMLNKALTTMIDNCDFFFFLDTENSLKYDSIENRENTHSAWINSEIEISNIVRIRERGKRGIYMESDQLEFKNNALLFSYSPKFYDFIHLEYARVKNFNEYSTVKEKFLSMLEKIENGR